MHHRSLSHMHRSTSTLSPVLPQTSDTLTSDTTMSQQTARINLALAGSGIFAQTSYLPALLAEQGNINLHSLWSRSKRSTDALTETAKELGLLKSADEVSLTLASRQIEICMRLNLLASKPHSAKIHAHTEPRSKSTTAPTATASTPSLPIPRLTPSHSFSPSLRSPNSSSKRSRRASTSSAKNRSARMSRTQRR